MCLSPVVRLPAGKGKQAAACSMSWHPAPVSASAPVPALVSPVSSGFPECSCPFFISPARLWLNCQMCLGAVSPFHCPRSWPCASAFPHNRIKKCGNVESRKSRKSRGTGVTKDHPTAEALYSIHRTNLHVSAGPIHVEPREAFEVLWLPFDNLAHEWGFYP